VPGAVQQDETVERADVPLLDCPGQRVAPRRVPRPPGEQVQFGSGVQHATDTVQGIDQTDGLFFFQAEPQLFEPVQEGGWWRGREEGVFSVSELPAVRQPDAPRPDLLPRLLAAENEDVFMDGTGDQVLELPQQASVQQHHTVRRTPEHLDAPLVCDGLKAQRMPFGRQRLGAGGAIPTQGVDEQRRQAVVSQVVGHGVHGHLEDDIDQPEGGKPAPDGRQQSSVHQDYLKRQQTTRGR
jgi:hypothetical protein